MCGLSDLLSDIVAIVLWPWVVVCVHSSGQGWKFAPWNSDFKISQEIPLCERERLMTSFFFYIVFVCFLSQMWSVSSTVCAVTCLTSPLFSVRTLLAKWFTVGDKHSKSVRFVLICPLASYRGAFRPEAATWLPSIISGFPPLSNIHLFLFFLLYSNDVCSLVPEQIYVCGYSSWSMYGSVLASVYHYLGVPAGV